jgi:hypothetical protein
MMACCYFLASQLSISLNSRRSVRADAGDCRGRGGRLRVRRVRTASSRRSGAPRSASLSSCPARRTSTGERVTREVVSASRGDEYAGAPDHRGLSAEALAPIQPARGGAGGITYDTFITRRERTSVRACATPLARSRLRGRADASLRSGRVRGGVDCEDARPAARRSASSGAMRTRCHRRAN